MSTAAFLSRMLFVCLAAIVLLGAAAALSPELLDQLDPLYPYRGPALLAAGGLLMSIGAVMVWWAQHDMGEAWRVGVDRGERTRLITHGLFRFCRNPIYLGLQVGLWGFLGLVPSYFTLTLVAVATVLFQVQVRLEESHLISQHGEPYADYCRRVGRFLPWTGRWVTWKAGQSTDRHAP
jgi:protein-S-isoprenylcysteine O-methyltransferase Ste14